jgi:hypothetical protein
MQGFRKFFLLICLIAPGPVCGQVILEVEDERVYATPSVRGMARSKGVVVRYEVAPNFRISSRSADGAIGGGTAEIKRNSRLDLRLFVPVLNKPALKLITGFQYFSENFQFGQPDRLSYPYYLNLEAKRLRTMGMQVVLFRSMGARSFYAVRVRGNLDGDYRSFRGIDLSRALRYTAEVVYGWKRSPTLSYGAALQMSYNYGRFSALPAIIYNHTFTDKWGVEAIFPAKVSLRHNVSDKTLLYAGYGGESSRYNLHTDNPRFAGVDSVQIRRIDVRGRLRWEQEIYDFLWFGVEGGYSTNLRFRAFADFSSRSRNYLIFSRLQGAPYLSVELFLVPPRRFSSKR